MDFSKLAMLRTKKDLTQREMAKILNVSKSTYARWETQEQIIPLYHLNNFCKYFNVTMDYILNITKSNRYLENDYTEEIDKTAIGNNIKTLRKKYRLTQGDLAKILNTSQSTISAYESGKTLVLTAFIYSLASQFNLSVDKLCGRNKPIKEVVKN